ncbi:MAG TPA: hypothetical protein VGC65_06010 [Bacteroidia bacterium]
MKLKQFHNLQLVIFEITDVSLKITVRKLFKKEIRETRFEDIQLKDRYELEYRDKAILSYIYICITFFVFFATHAALESHPDWTYTAIAGAVWFLFMLRFFTKRMKIYIPTTDKGIIRLYQKQPDKKSVEEFIYILEGKVNLAAKKMPEKDHLKKFGEEYFQDLK